MPATILLIEDEAPVRALLVRYLERQGYVVLACGDGAGALDAFRGAKAAIDLAIVDLSLPDMNGEDVISVLLAESETVKVLVSSGRPYSSEALPEEVRPRVEALMKPYLPQELLAAISAMLGPGQPSIS